MSRIANAPDASLPGTDHDKLPQRVRFDDGPGRLEAGNAFGQRHVFQPQEYDAPTAASLVEGKFAEILVASQNQALFGSAR